MSVIVQETVPNSFTSMQKDNICFSVWAIQKYDFKNRLNVLFAIGRIVSCAKAVFQLTIS